MCLHFQMTAVFNSGIIMGLVYLILAKFVIGESKT